MNRRPSPFPARWRRLAFELVDRVQGGRISQHVADLEGSFAHPEEVAETTGERLQRLLRHAAETTEHYRPFKGERRLEAFPILTKREIQERPQAFVSDRFARQHLIPVRTSGSTGTPLEVLFSTGKMARRRAEVLFFTRWAGYDVGVRHAFINAHHLRRPRWFRFLENQVFIDCNHMPPAWFEATRRALLKRRPEVLIGYPSTLAMLADFCRRRGDRPEDFGIRSIVPSGEIVTLADRSRMRRGFGCPVFSRYATWETGILAHEHPDHPGLLCNGASYVVELIEPGSDRPAPACSLGRVVVTDLFSDAMPLIRYDTGDFAVAEGGRFGLGPAVLSEIQGRLPDYILAPNGEVVHPFRFILSLAKVSGLLRFQVVQEGPGTYRADVIPAAGTADLAERVRSTLDEILGSDARVRVHEVAEIPPLPSGKRPPIVRLAPDLPPNFTESLAPEAGRLHA